jgi:hypothetical protein
MKYLYLLLFAFVLQQLIVFSSVHAQAITNSQSLELRGGKTFSAGDYVSLRYRHTTSTSIDLTLAAFVNGFQKNSLRYRCYGIDLLGEYYTGVGENTDHLFECKLGLGVTASLDNEPWVFRNTAFSRRLNYGICGEVSGEWCMSENIGLCLFGQQKYLFNNPLGTTAFTLGMGIKLNLD